jgi:hypothetical protein
MNEYQYRDTIGFINDTFTAKAKPQILWTENTLKNLPRIEKDEGIWSLHEHLYGDKERAVVVVGASPSLMGAIPELKKLDRKRFCIVVVNSALKVLLKNKIL